MLSNLAAALVATFAGVVEMRIGVQPDLVFGDPIQVEVEFVNNGTAAVQVPKLWLSVFAFTLVNPATGKTLLEPLQLLSFEPPADVSFTLAPGETRAERANLWPFISGTINWIEAQGLLATPGLLYPGRYRLTALAHPLMGVPTGFSALRATTEFVVKEGNRTRELGIVRKAYAESVSPEYGALASAVEQLRACCSDSPVLEPVWKAACLTPAGTPETLQCADGFLKRFPSSWWAGPVRDHAPEQVERNEAYAEDVAARKAASLAEVKRFGEAMNTQSNDVLLKLTQDFIRDFPGSALAPKLLGRAISALESGGREREAQRMAEELVNRYPDSGVVRRWTGSTKLPVPAASRKFRDGGK